MTKRKGSATLIAFVVLLSATVFPGVLVARPALDGPEAADEEAILELLISRYADRPYIGVYETTEGLNVGDWRTIHRFSDEFYTKEVTESLGSEIELIRWEWLAPLRYYSATVGALTAMGTDRYSPASVWAEDFGQDLDELQASDVVVHDAPGGLWFAVRGEDAIPLGDDSSERIGGTQSLRELQDIFFGWYDPLRQASLESGEWVLGGGASGSSTGESRLTRDAPTATSADGSGGRHSVLARPALAGSAALLLGLAALLAGWSRLRRNKGSAG